MEFGLDEAQVELQATVARFCADRLPFDTIGAREQVPVDRSVWGALADLGTFGLLLPEEAGGSALGVLEAAIVFEQLGSHLAPGPVVWQLLAAPLVDGAATGAPLVAGVEAGAIGPDGRALVEHAVGADVVLVLHPDRVVAHTVDDLSLRPLDPFDPLTPVAATAGLDGPGVVVGDAEAARRAQLLGTVLGAAALVGVASRSLEVARAYALEREQFGVVIGSFQALKHLLADAYVRVNLAQSATYAAAAILDDPRADDPAAAARAASGAKLLAAEAAAEGAATAVQVLGGMGFTWAMLPNVLVKRARVLASSFGTVDDHAALLGAALVATSQ